MNGKSKPFTIILSIALFIIYALTFHWTPTTHVTITRNILNGELNIDSIAGPSITPPWVQAANIDTRPQRICIECKCRNINCKLIAFNHEHWKQLIDKEGFRYFWWDNRLSFNLNHNNEYRGIRDLLKGYAFDGKHHEFLTQIN